MSSTTNNEELLCGTEHDPKTSPGNGRFDPFDGFFDNGRFRLDQLPDYLQTERARRWFDVVGWGVENGLYTYQQPLAGRSGPHVRVDGKELLMMSSYDYLGLIGHPAIERAAVDAVEQYGTGSGGVRFLTGTTELHCELERELAEFKGTEASVTFTSGYLANVGVITALVGPRDRVILDSRSHRSIVDGCQLARVPFRFFLHNDPASLKSKLGAAPCDGRTLIVVEGTYSMDGDICCLPEIVRLKREYGAMLMVDEAHSFGVLGATGRGVDEHFGIATDEVDIWMGSLSKAIPANGGFLAASRALVIYLQHEVAPFVFSAALCPAAAATACAALRVLQAEPSRLETVRRNAHVLRSGLAELGYDTAESETPIVPVVIGDDVATWKAARRLLDEDVLATPIVFPAVAPKACRLRLCAMASHTENDLEQALNAFEALAAC